MKLTPTFNFGRPYRSIWSVLLGFFLIFTLFGGVPSKSALAFENSYISDTLFYNDPTDGLIFQFYVKTSFDPVVSDYFRIFYIRPGDCSDNSCIYAGLPGYSWYINLNSAFEPDPTDGTTLTAGNTYKFYFKEAHDGVNQPITKARYEYYLGHTLTPADFLYTYASQQFWSVALPTNTIVAYYSEFPTLTITYPADNTEIAESFYITGSFTQPNSQYQYLTAFISAVGGESYIDVFNQVINGAESGEISIWINGLSAGYYDFDIYMRDNESNFYPQGGWPITNIHIVNDLSFTLPPYGGQPPTTAPPVFQPLEPANYYTENSEYSTSTALYNTLTGTFAPIILAIGDSLTNLAQNFTQSNASSTGNQLGQSILLVRSYLTNINAFFSNFPVGQFLLLYLIALVVVIVLRLVKGLIGLFKI
jgi:hypothetical protein